MSSAFTHRPTTHYGGVPVETWLRTYWDNAVFRGPHNKSAVAFRDFKPVHGTPGAYFATPVAIVNFREAEAIAISGSATTTVVKLNDVIVPLGDPDWSNDKTRVVLQQVARQWVSGGTNTANMSDENVLTMYYAALQSLVFTAGNATTATDQRVWFSAIVSITRALALLHRVNETFRRVTEAMVLTPGTNDMLQKSLAHVFHPEAPWDQRTKLEVLEVVTRRAMRHGTTFVGMAPGAFIIYVLVPLLRDVVATCSTAMSADVADLMLARFNREAGALLTAYVAATSSDTATMQAATLVALGEAAGFEPTLTLETATKFLDFCRATPDMSAVAPWAEWGLVAAPPTLDADVRTERFGVAGKKGASHATRLVVHTPTTFDVLSFKGIEWCGVQFASLGKYIVTAHDLGIADGGKGNTRGKELVANWRLTVGSDVLPRDRHGYSSAGMFHQRSEATGKWSYIENKPVPLSEPFVIRVAADHVALLHKSHVLASIARNYGSGDEPALLAFKNLWLSVQFEPAVETAIATTPVKGGAATLDLPPTALMEQLRTMAEKAAAATASAKK